MSRMKRALERVASQILGGHDYDLDFLDKRHHVLTPEKPKASLEDRKAQQRRMMVATTTGEGSRGHGYEPVPIEVLRTDKGILRLLDMLEHCRPGGTQDEQDYIDTYLYPLENGVRQDSYGNTIIEVAIPEGHPRILWSSHTDTVHRHGGKQKVEITNGVAWTSDGSCLGSDDTIGNWLMAEMILAKVPGTYVFHREEESGGGGSSWLAKEHGEWLGTFDCAIALDRADYFDVITHQAGGRCCSNAFAMSLAAVIGGGFKPCDGGVFTDTANYTHLIGECTNLSVGYFRQHGPMEHTNLGFALRLRDAILAADWSKLVFERKPEDEDDWYLDLRNTKRAGGHAYGDEFEDDLEDFCYRNYDVVARFLAAQAIGVDDIQMWEEEEAGDRGRWQ